uniref:Uncharacterized protein n=1 Tax=Chromera velia CCMP2878 TaxID=1169474 RepID=A0A0G4FVC4_9ALVE|eukprot:Cvel_18955.t1-p1 / transcript=Cvel_18955.t1 / gene=Cvel_18955 / organism=Chromera_velia_CCMP2878 / gene_product=hypothetical protein / transcript_product=hypothetical protein / location=Cvel_scaffold1602:13567-18655(-) / protein_length=1001 / sequence_SO=supercontig / SO=protein_coding / is_pseudo=false
MDNIFGLEEERNRIWDSVQNNSDRDSTNAPVTGTSELSNLWYRGPDLQQTNESRYQMVQPLSCLVNPQAAGYVPPSFFGRGMPAVVPVWASYCTVGPDGRVSAAASMSYGVLEACGAHINIAVSTRRGSSSGDGLPVATATATAGTRVATAGSSSFTNKCVQDHVALSLSPGHREQGRDAGRARCAARNGARRVHKEKVRDRASSPPKPDAVSLSLSHTAAAGKNLKHPTRRQNYETSHALVQPHAARRHMPTSSKHSRTSAGPPSHHNLLTQMNKQKKRSTSNTNSFQLPSSCPPPPPVGLSSSATFQRSPNTPKPSGSESSTVLRIPYEPPLPSERPPPQRMSSLGRSDSTQKVERKTSEAAPPLHPVDNHTTAVLASKSPSAMRTSPRQTKQKTKPNTHTGASKKSALILSTQSPRGQPSAVTGPPKAAATRPSKRATQIPADQHKKTKQGPQQTQTRLRKTQQHTSQEGESQKLPPQKAATPATPLMKPREARTYAHPAAPPQPLHPPHIPTLALMSALPPPHGRPMNASPLSSFREGTASWGSMNRMAAHGGAAGVPGGPPSTSSLRCPHPHPHGGQPGSVVMGIPPFGGSRGIATGPSPVHPALLSNRRTHPEPQAPPFDPSPRGAPAPPAPSGHAYASCNTLPAQACKAARSPPAPSSLGGHLGAGRGGGSETVLARRDQQYVKVGIESEAVGHTAMPLPASTGVSLAVDSVLHSARNPQTAGGSGTLAGSQGSLGTEQQQQIQQNSTTANSAANPMHTRISNAVPTGDIRNSVYPSSLRSLQSPPSLHTAAITQNLNALIHIPPGHARHPHPVLMQISPRANTQEQQQTTTNDVNGPKRRPAGTSPPTRHINSTLPQPTQAVPTNSDNRLPGSAKTNGNALPLMHHAAFVRTASNQHPGACQTNALPPTQVLRQPLQPVPHNLPQAHACPAQQPYIPAAKTAGVAAGRSPVPFPLQRPSGASPAAMMKHHAGAMLSAPRVVFTRSPPVFSRGH